MKPLVLLASVIIAMSAPTRSSELASLVAVDNDFAVWRGFGNRYWPALSLLNGQGRVRYRHFGEDIYDASERAIQELLAEAGARRVERDLVSVELRGAEVAADWANVGSPGTYVGPRGASAE